MLLAESLGSFLWWILEKKGLIRYNEVVKDRYVGATNKVRTTTGETELLPFSIGIHQGRH